MNFSHIFIKRPVATVLVMVAILFFGIVAYKKLPVSDLPNVNYPAMTVYVDYPGANPEVVANTVVSPLERQFLTIEGVTSIASTSSMENATIVLQFALDKKIDSAALDVQTAINAATPDLPEDVTPTYEKVNPSQTPILYFAVSSETMPIYQLYEYAHTFIAERINTVSGVAQVVIYGSPFAVRVQVNPQKLAAKGIGIDEVANAIQNGNVNLPTGSLFGKTGEYTLDVKGGLNRAALYDSIILKNDAGNIVRIKDVGKAIDSTLDDKQYLRYLSSDCDQACVIFGILTQAGVNSMRVIKDINTMLPDLEKNLPGSVNLYRVFDKSDYIKEAVRDVEGTLLLAFGLVVLVIFLYLGNPSNTLIPTVVLPLSIIGTFAIMYLLGFTIDILSLLAITLSIGFLVDDAIVVLENIVRHVELGKSRLDAALEGSKEIGFTVLSMTLSLISVFIPLLFLGGVIGKLFHEFAIVIISAILFSGFVSLTLTPLLCSLFVRQSSPQKFSLKLNEKLVMLYHKTLLPVLNRPKLTLCLGLISICFTFVLFKILPRDFIPPDDIGLVVVHTQAPTGTSPFQMMKYQAVLGQMIKNHPAIDSILSMGAMPDDNKGSLFIRLKPFKDRGPITKVIHELKEIFHPYSAIQCYVKSLPLIDLQVTTSDGNAPFQYTLQSLYPDLLYTATDTLMQKMKTIPFFSDISTDLEIRQPKLQVEILRDKASSLNLTAESIQNTFSYAFAATHLSPINDPEYQYYTVLEVEPKFYGDPDLLSQLYVRSSTHKLIPIKEVTKMVPTVSPLNLNRLNGLPAVNIFFDIGTGALGTALEKLDHLTHETLPPNVVGKIQGTADVFKTSFSNISILLLISFFIIYIILGILYENFLHPITVMSTIPTAALGGLLTLYLFHIPLSLYAFVGLILLLGIVMKNGIILIDFANDRLLAGKSPKDAILDACKARFRPILMTTCCAMMGAVPIALGLGGMTAQSRSPLGLVIIGGLILSQILTLYLTPVLYLYLENLRLRMKLLKR